MLGRANTFVVGGNAEWLDFTRYMTMWPGMTDVVSLVNPVPGSYPSTGATITQAQDNVVRTYSVFAENRLEVSRALSLVGGLRYDHERLRRIDLVTSVHTEALRNHNPVNWRGGAVYELVPGINLYGQYSEATDAISNVCCLTAAQMLVDAARGRQLEAGIKQSTLGGRLEWTVAGYRIVKTDLLVPDPILLATLIQVGSQSSKGLEATVAFDIEGGIRVGANGTVLDPQYDEFFENVGRGGRRAEEIGVQQTGGGLPGEQPHRRLLRLQLHGQRPGQWQLECRDAAFVRGHRHGRF